MSSSLLIHKGKDYHGRLNVIGARKVWQTSATDTGLAISYAASQSSNPDVQLIGTIVGSVVSGCTAAATGNPAWIVTAAAANTAAAGGNSQDIIFSAASAWAAFGVGHGGAGGGSYFESSTAAGHAVPGGKFTVGGVVGRTSAAAILGGLTSAALGGDARQGARRAALVHLFNNEVGSAIAQKGLTQDQINNMSPAGLVKHWATGDGGDIYFGPDSIISQLFSQGDGAALLEELFYAKFNGNPPHLGKMDRVDYKYTWFFRAFNLNSAVQVMGTWKGHAVRAHDQVLFRAENTMSFSSLTFGRQRAETGWDWLNPKAFGPKANDLNITIEWSSPVR